VCSRVGRCTGARTSHHLHPLPRMCQTGAPSRRINCPAHHHRQPSAASLSGSSNRCLSPTDSRFLRPAVWHAWWSHSSDWCRWLRCPPWTLASHHLRPLPGGDGGHRKCQLAGASAHVVRTAPTTLSSPTIRSPSLQHHRGLTPWQRPWLTKARMWLRLRRGSPSATSLPAGSWRCHQLPEKSMIRPST
jgi:hypothetical protein